MGENNLRMCVAASLNFLTPLCNAADLCVKTLALRRHHIGHDESPIMARPLFDLLPHPFNLLTVPLAKILLF